MALYYCYLVDFSKKFGIYAISPVVRPDEDDDGDGDGDDGDDGDTWQAQSGPFALMPEAQYLEQLCLDPMNSTAFIFSKF